ncbi:hypothetical protein [Hydrogenophaga sp. PAMC20947]|uniref:hypothetical protein n=1 Tax=Hydrogenophaga sp. PAMC20947 TaxID=2565558 RepID=UPI00109E3128|nr:hypothetical protein [Hydrogenophaga sp. PAMC20947]QCB45134.1 hypothetical protein E5678_03265 [Hydrogenophaga sp. PAMC20947]
MNSKKQHTTDLKSAMRDPFGVAIVAYYLVMAVIGMLIPDDIMSHQWAREFSDFMAGIVPQIDRITALNIKPDINRFYFSLLWAGAPICAVIIILGALVRGVNEDFVEYGRPILKPMIAVLALGLASLWLLLLPGVQNTDGVIFGLIGNFFARGLIAQVIFVNGPLMLCVGGFILFPYFLLTGKYQQKSI